MTLLKSNGAAQSASDDEIDLSELVAVLRERAGLVALATAFALLVGVGYAFLGTPIYRADAMIQVDDDAAAGSINDKLGDLASLFQNKASADAEIELLRSRMVVGEAVERLRLDVDARVHRLPLIGAAIARYRSRLLTGDASGNAAGSGRLGVARFDVPPRLYESKFRLIADGGERFHLLDPDGNTVLSARVGEAARGSTAAGPVHLSVSALDGPAGTRYDLTRFSTQQTVSDLQKALDITERSKQSGIIGVRLDGDDAERVTATVNMIASLYVQRNVDRKSAQAQQMLAFLGDQLPGLRADLDLSEARYNAFRARHGAIDLEAQGRLLLQSVVDAKTRLIELQQQRAELVQRFTAAHPAVTAIDARIAGLERQQGQYEQQIAGLPAVHQQALRLMRDVRVNTDLYMKLLDSTQQLRVLKAGQLGNVRTVDYAVVPEEPVRPKKLFVIPLAAVLGLVLGCGLAVGRRLLERGLSSPAEIEQAVEVPVYAIISHSDRQLALQQSVRRNPSRPGVLAAVFPDDIAVEGLRSLRTALQFGVLRPGSNVVMLTGPRPGVGKSFVSVNLATVLAATGKRILLIDADLRRGDVHAYFPIDGEPGLAEAIAGADPAAVIHRQVLPNLDVMTAGAPPERPSELLMRERFGRLLEQFAAAYDMVIVDSPPVLAVTDPGLIGKHAGATLLVVRHGRHSAAELRESARQLASAGVSVDGVLLTDVPQRGSTYGAYSEYRKKSG